MTKRIRHNRGDIGETIRAALIASEDGAPLKVITAKTSYGAPLVFFKASLRKGRGLLAQAGFTRSLNPNYMKRGDTCVHYNRIMRAWIIEVEAEA